MTARASRPVLVVHGTDRPGVVAAVTKLLADYSANIVSLDQYSTDPVGGQFFQRTEFIVPDF
ncbi:MAG TPA: ACT domain-containing protein, partial [Microbacteriaceae bacterium]|nr:ACT domain-containing protein [Microbacteriaceae bacterium]